MIAADIRHDLERMVIGADGDLALTFEELESEALAQIEAEHAGYERVEFRRFAELRYAGQHHALSVEVPASDESLAGVEAAFQDKHDRLYGFRRDDTPVELMRIQLSAIGRIQRADGRRRDVPSGAVSRPRELRRL